MKTPKEKIIYRAVCCVVALVIFVAAYLGFMYFSIGLEVSQFKQFHECRYLANSSLWFAMWLVTHIFNAISKLKDMK